MEQVYENGKRQTQKAVNKTADKVSEMASDITSQSVVSDFLGQAQDWYRSAGSVAGDVAKKSADVTKRYPIRSVIGAAAIGFLAAILFRRRA
jgi:hypothetical protein